MSGSKRHAIEARLARIEGHIHAVHTMAHDGKSYPELVHQIAAVRSSLDSVLQAIVDDLVQECIRSNAVRGHGSSNAAFEDLQAVVSSAL